MLLEKDSFNNNTAIMSKSVIDLWIKILCNHQMIRIKSKHFICDYTHLRSTIARPASSYSPFVIHRDWKVSNDAKIDPPIHADNLRSVGGAMILTFSAGAREVISFWIRSTIPWNIVDPPVRTMLAHSSLRVSSSHFMIELYVVSWILQIPLQERKAGTWPRDIGISHFRWWWPDHQEVHTFSASWNWIQRYLFLVRNLEQRSTASLWCHVPNRPQQRRRSYLAQPDTFWDNP